MKIPRGFIGQKERWFGDNRASHCNQLLLAATKLARKQILFGDDAKAVERVGNNRLALGTFHVAIGEGNVEVFGDCKVFQQVKLLKNETNVLFVKCGAFFRWELVDSRLIKVILAIPGAVLHSDD